MILRKKKGILPRLKVKKAKKKKALSKSNQVECYNCSGKGHTTSHCLGLKRIKQKKK